MDREEVKRQARRHAEEVRRILGAVRIHCRRSNTTTFELLAGHHARQLLNVLDTLIRFLPLACVHQK